MQAAVKAAFALAAVAAAGPAGACAGAGRGLLQSESCGDVAPAFYCRSITTFRLCSFNTPWCLESCGACPSPRVQSASEEVPPLNLEEVFEAPGCEGGCCDVAPPTSAYSCEQQAAWGKCGASWMAGFCFASCGRCVASEDAATNMTVADPFELLAPVAAENATNMTVVPVEEEPVEERKADKKLEREQRKAEKAAAEQLELQQEESMPDPVPEPDAPDNATAVGGRAGRADADQDANCSFWAASGECDLNSAWMLENCATSCANVNNNVAYTTYEVQKICVDAGKKKKTAWCQDKQSDCASLAAAGECMADPKKLHRVCPTSCGVARLSYCEEVKGSDSTGQSGGGGNDDKGKCADVVDNQGACQTWANAGECKTNPVYMEKECKKSCNICRSGGGGGGGTASGGQEGQYGRPSCTSKITTNCSGTGERAPGFLDRLSDAVNSLGGSDTVGALVGPING